MSDHASIHITPYRGTICSDEAADLDAWDAAHEDRDPESDFENSSDPPSDASSDDSSDTSPETSEAPDLCNQILDTTRETLAEVKEKLFVDLPDQFLNSVTMIAGFLVIAAFPLLTQDFSSDPNFQPTHFSPQAVRSFAGISVGLFLTDIIACQATKLLFLVLSQERAKNSGQQRNSRVVLGTHDVEKGYLAPPADLPPVDPPPVHPPPSHPPLPNRTASRRRVIVLVGLLELLAVAIIFLLLIIAAYAFALAMVFLLLDGLFALACLALPWSETMIDAMARKKQSVITAMRDRKHKKQKMNNIGERRPESPVFSFWKRQHSSDVATA